MIFVFSYCLDYLLTSQKGSSLPPLTRGLSKKLVRLAAVQNSKYVDDNLLIKNPGSNDGKRQL